MAQKGKKRTPSSIFKLVAYTSTIISIAIYFYPFYFILILSLKANIFVQPPELFPLNPDISGYTFLFSRPAFIDWVKNSFIYSVCISVGIILMSSLTGYTFSRLNFPGKAQLFWLILGLMMIPGVVSYIPLYITLGKLKLINSYWGVILPPIASPYSAFLLKQSFDAIPKDYEECAYIDGAKRLTILFRIFLPLARPALITLALFQFVWNWNNFAWPLFVTTSIRMYNLPLAIWYMTYSYSRDFWTEAAGGILVMLTPFILYLIGVQYFLRGIVVTGLKK